MVYPNTRITIEYTISVNDTKPKLASPNNSENKQQSLLRQARINIHHKFTINSIINSSFDYSPQIYFCDKVWCLMDFFVCCKTAKNAILFKIKSEWNRCQKIDWHNFWVDSWCTQWLGFTANNVSYYFSSIVVVIRFHPIGSPHFCYGWRGEINWRRKQ